MIIKSVYVENFRCIRSETLDCERLTALVGANGTGKSTFLRALQLFYAAGASYTEQDFYGRDTSSPILIRVTFGEFTDEEMELFSKHIVNEMLTVEKELTWPSGRGAQKYYGASLRNLDFQAIRSATNASEMKQLYQDLQKQAKYGDLPGWSRKDDVPITLEAWENGHPDLCSMGRDDGQFFGFKEVGRAHLERFTRFLFIPAVRDASEDAAEGRGSVLSDLMDLVVRSTLAARQDFQELQEDTQKRYDEIMGPANLNELTTLQASLSETLGTYAPDAFIRLDWVIDQKIDIPMPKADISLIEDGYPSSVARAGHGVQRAFILTMLQHLAKAQVPASTAAVDSATSGEGARTTTTAMPNLILGIEEPELYQHPTRQRHIASVLYKLATGQIEGVARNTQILYATHSPLFVDLEHFHAVRLLRKLKPDSGGPKCTAVFQTTLDGIAGVLEEADGKPHGTYSGATLQPRLQALMTPWMNEGFFANVAVLVEGEDDRAAILGIARSRGYDFDSMGISVIPCMGKNNLDRPTAIFRGLRIPVYVVWDGDFGDKAARPEDNHRLLRLMEAELSDWPETVQANFSCLKQDLETTLCTELGEEFYHKVLDERRAELGYARDKDAIKCPAVIQRIIESAHQEGRTSAILEGIVEAIVALREP